jgi:N-acetyl-alpha-D-glucosaminyl L-malate synthase BshA
MADVARTYDLDLLHVHYAIPHSISAMLARQMMGGKLPFITTLHGTDITLVGMDPSYFAITKFSIEESDGVTAISEDLRRHTLEVFGVANEISVVHNFVNCTTYAPDPEKKGIERFAPNGEKLLIHLSNFRPVKRVADCVRILAEARKHVDARLLMVGDGPDRVAAEHLASELGVRQQVEFVGKQNGVERLIRLADALLMPSEMESFGLAALEAMACGVPAIGTRVGGVPELVTDGEDGFLERVGDIAAMSEKATRLLSESGLRDKMGKAARRTATTRFCTEKIIPQYEAIYEKVANASSLPASPRDRSQSPPPGL